MGRREALQQVQNFRGDGTVRSQLAFKLLQLVGAWEKSMPQKVNHLFKIGVRGKVVDVVPTIREDAFFSVNGANL
jgi:hypothetical protein